MGIGIFGTLHIAKEALYTQQSSVGVSAHNIANVNTPGYSRQSPVIEPIDPQKIGGIYFGRGATLTTITKSYDRFLNNSINIEKSVLGRWQIKDTYMSQAESLFNESSQGGLNALMNEFWNAWHDLADHPEGIAERAVLQRSGEMIAGTIRGMVANLERIRADANNRIADVVGKINQLAKEIAQLNTQILGTETVRANANDLTDQRSLKIEELATYIDITPIQSGNGMVTILTATGKPLVSDNLSWELAVEVNAQRDNLFAVIYKDRDRAIDITDLIRGGNLRGLVEVRDIIVPGYLDAMDELAATLVNEINKVHYQGYGLDGSTGNYFFRPVQFTSEAAAGNTGGSALYDVRITDPARLKASDFAVSFTAAHPQTARYEISDEREGRLVYHIDSSNATIVFDDSGIAGIESTADLTKGTYSGAELAAEIQRALEQASASGQRYRVSYNELHRQFSITNLGAEEIALRWTDANTTAADILGFRADAAAATNATVTSTVPPGRYDYAAFLFEVTALNQTIECNLNDGFGVRTAILQEGIYTAQKFSAEVKRALEAAGPAEFTVAFDAQQRFTITAIAAPGLVDLNWSTSTARTLLGFEAADTIGLDPAGGNTNAVRSAAAAGTYRYLERTFTIEQGINDSVVYDDGGIGDGTGGTFVTGVLRAGQYTGSELAAEIERMLESTAGSSGQNYIVTFDAQQGRFVIINGMSAAAGAHAITIDWASAGSTAAAALGFDTAPLVLNAGDSGRSDNETGMWAPHKILAFHGMSAKLSDVQGRPASRDVLRLTSLRNASRLIAMDPVGGSDPLKIAAASALFDITGRNNTLVFDNDGDLTDGTVYRVVLETGTYTADALAGEIERQLEMNGAAPASYAVRYDHDQHRFALASNPSNPEPLVVLWEHPESTAAFILGFNPAQREITPGAEVFSDFQTGAPAVGDNRSALAVGDLKDMPVLGSGTLTMDAFYNMLVGRVGTDVQETESSIRQQSFMIDQFEQRRQSIAGVSMDDEMIDLIKFQHAYAAATKLITTLDTMLELLISLKR